jgi:integrase
MNETIRDFPQAGGIFNAFVADYDRRGKFKTCRTYRGLLGKFAEWVADREVGENFTRDHVVEFLEHGDWSNSTKNLFLAALHGWAEGELQKVSHPTTPEEVQEERRLLGIKGVKSYATHPKEKGALTLEQVSELLDVMDSDTASVFWSLLWFGVRFAEFQTMQIDFDKKEATIETKKGGGTRKLYFDDYTERILRRVVDRGLQVVAHISLWKRLKRYSRPIGVELAPHICRHTFATHFSQIADPFALKQMLGHKMGGGVTGAYVHPLADQIRRLMTEKHYLKPLEAS